MLQFINGNDTQFSWLRSQIQDATMIFNDVSLPTSCNPSRCRLGFEYTHANGFKLYIDKNISFSGNHPEFRSLLATGEMSFNNYEDMKVFVRGLAYLFTTTQNVVGAHPRSFLSTFFPTPSPVSQPTYPYILTYPVTSPRGNRMTFSFKYELHGPIWRAFIVNSPSYGSRSTSPGTIHRLTHTDGRYYVCWQPEPQRLDQITEVSKNWAEATAKYIDTGVFG